MPQASSFETRNSLFLAGRPCTASTKLIPPRALPLTPPERRSRRSSPEEEEEESEKQGQDIHPMSSALNSQLCQGPC